MKDGKQAILKSGRVRIQIRNSILSYLSRTFHTASEADEFIQRIESEVKKIREIDNANFPVDKAALYQSLHPDIQQAVQLLPIFANVLGRRLVMN